jgi:dienelactone hydrolase
LVAHGAERPDAARSPESVERPQAVSRASGTTYAYPPSPAESGAARPAVVYLHGKCGVATNGCSHFRQGAASFGWLLCPVGNDPCPGGGASWAGSALQKKKVVDDALDSLASANPGAVDVRAPSVLVGFSQGAWTALDLVRAAPGRYRGVLLIGGDVSLDVPALDAAGVRRLVMIAGARDGAFAPMQATARHFANASPRAPEVRFVSLGAVGHTYVGETDAILRETLEWLEAPARDELAVVSQG